MELSVELLLHAYESGYFPMAESRESQELLWFNPDPRAVIDLTKVHVPRSVKKLVRKCPFRISVNTAFEDIMRMCAMPRRDEGDSWINADIIALYTEMHALGYAHSVECWDHESGTLMGGLYGVSRGGAFFGESMCSRVSGASKVAYVYLLELLIRGGFTLLDTQFVNAHLAQFQVREIARDDYLAQLENALIVSPNPSHQFCALAGNVMSWEPSVMMVMQPLASR